MIEVLDYDPESDFSPNMRDVFALRENILPAQFNDRSFLCQYVGVEPKEFKLEVHLPLAIAKWRYQMADAMIAARKPQQKSTKRW